MGTLRTCLWFDGKAEEAARFYVSLLPDSRIDAVARPGGEASDGSPAKAMSVEFTLLGQPFLALNGGPHYAFTPAVSFMVPCADQPEIDRLWDALGSGGTFMRCGWLTDRYGVSWQIVPAELGAMAKDPERGGLVMKALMSMVKLEIAPLRRAFEGG